jgi:hypothetical protein
MNFSLAITGRESTHKEFILALDISLRELGHRLDLSNICYKDKIRKEIKDFHECLIVIMGSHSWDYLPKNSLKILIFMEQKNQTSYIQKRHGYDYILDVFDYNYNKYNKPTLPKNIPLSIGWSEAFEYNIKNTKISDDYFLFGGVSGYRRSWSEINELSISSGIWGSSRDKKIVGSKINLMIKAYEEYSLPPLHTNLILCRKKFLMVEEHNNYGIYVPNKHFQIFSKDNYHYWLKHDGKRREFEQNAYEDFKKNHKFTEYLGRAFEQIEELR